MGNDAEASSSDSFEWCSGLYTWEDLAGALDTLCPSGTSHIQPCNSWTQHLSDSDSGFSQQPSHAHFSSSGSPQHLLLQLNQIPADQQRWSSSSAQQDEAEPEHAAKGVHKCDPWQAAAWQSLTPQAQALLLGLSAVESIPWVGCNTLPSTPPRPS